MSLAPFKEEMAEALRYLKHSLRKSDVQVRLHQKGDVSTVLAFGPDAVIVATGSRPARPLIPGIDSDLCVDAREVYEGKQVSGRKIVIIGGGDIGCETADWLADPDRQITVVEMLPQVLTKMKKVPKERLLSRLSEKRVNILTEAEAVSLKSDGVLVKKKGEEPVLLEADRVIFATDAEQEDSLIKALAGKIKEIVTVGDAASPGDLGSALRSATRVALEI
jgi:pyruvate/2-oxoglutarate dehydrogenase complex dihydrolipoamide dehydrogenase (E3) component